MSWASRADNERERIFLLFAQIFIFQLGFGMLVPVVPAYGESFGLGPAGVGLLVGMYGLARAATDLPTILLVRRVGLTRAFSMGAATLAAGSVICGVAPNGPVLFLGRLVAGAGSACTLVTGQATAAERPGPFTRSQAIGYYQAVFLAGVTLGPTIGGVAADMLGQRAVFHAYGLIGIVVAAVGMVDGGGHRAGTGQVDRMAASTHDGIRAVLPLLRQRQFILPSLLMALQNFTRTGAIHALVPLLAAADLGLSATRTGLAFGIMGLVNVIATVFVARLMDHVSRGPMFVVSATMAALGLGGYAISSGFAGFVAASVLWGMGTAISVPATAVAAAESATDRRSLEPLALYRAVSDVGYIVGPTLLGVLAALTSTRAALVAMAVAFLLFTAWLGTDRTPPDHGRADSGSPEPGESAPSRSERDAGARPPPIRSSPSRADSLTETVYESSAGPVSRSQRCWRVRLGLTDRAPVGAASDGAPSSGAWPLPGRVGRTWRRWTRGASPVGW